MRLLEHARVGALTAMQAIFLLSSMLLFAAIVLLRVPVTDGFWFSLSAVLILLATIGSFFAGSSTPARARGSLVILFIDVAAVTALRTGMLDSVPSVSLLAVLPIVWLAGGYPRWGAVLGVGSAAFIAAVPRLFRGEWPLTSADALQFALPIGALVVLALATNAGARVFNRRSIELEAVRAQHQQARAIAAEHDALARSIVDSLDLGIAVFAPDGSLRTANAAALQFARAAGVDLSAPRAAPTTASPALHADRRSPVDDDDRMWVAAALGRARPARTEWIGPSDRPRALNMSTRAVVRSDDVVIGTMLVTRDVTEEERARQMRHDFLAAVSHELRTPLTPLLGHLELLEDEAADDPRVRGRIEVLRRNAQRLSDRMDELALAGDDTPELQTAPCDLAELLHLAVARSRGPAAAKQVRMRVDAPASAALTGDAPRLATLLDALLSNAVKFAPERSRVDVALHVDDEAITLVVENEGPAIPADEEHLLFEPFMRGRHAHEQAIAGFGLGLSQASGIVRAHDGRLVVHSPAGSGATARVMLPRTAQDPPG